MNFIKINTKRMDFLLTTGSFRVILNIPFFNPFLYAIKDIYIFVFS